MVVVAGLFINLLAAAEKSNLAAGRIVLDRHARIDRLGPVALLI